MFNFSPIRTPLLLLCCTCINLIASQNSTELRYPTSTPPQTLRGFHNTIPHERIAAACATEIEFMKDGIDEKVDHKYTISSKMDGIKAHYNYDIARYSIDPEYTHLQVELRSVNAHIAQLITMKVRLKNAQDLAYIQHPASVSPTAGQNILMHD